MAGPWALSPLRSLFLFSSHRQLSTMQKQLRIASLLPSTTDICASLGLQDKVVGITHECDFPAAVQLISYTDIADGNQAAPKQRPFTLTVSHIDPHVQSQSEIDTAVKSSLHNGISLYNLNDTALSDCNPSIILTQSLCDVCAVSKDDVDKEVACNLPASKVLSLEPESLEDVADTFVTIADACGVRERGVELRKRFFDDIDKVSKIVSTNCTKVKPPTVMFMEWIDPPFDGGHWIPDMIERSGCTSSISTASKSTMKSTQLHWEQVYGSDPDVVIIACCGFDLKRNIQDAISVKDKLKPLRAFSEGNIFAADGNLYFARPGPALREGVAIIASCAFNADDDVKNSLDQLGFLPEEGKGWARVKFDSVAEDTSNFNGVVDVEDLVTADVKYNYTKCHDDACKNGEDTYIDPKTGYSVFTELAHKRRGKCCGSGCRHCPYNHVNVKDKSKMIQQPAFLYEGVDAGKDQESFFTPIMKIPPNSNIKVLFFSGGKDSFLAIRRLVKQQHHQTAINGETTSCHLILLTTFDSDSRVIAHQEVHIDQVLRQAQHLGIPLLAIPLCRASGETYISRLEKGLNVIRSRISDIKELSLVFGDLHLSHIREWREKELGKYTLEYPLWKVPYSDLIADLEESEVRVVVSASTKEEMQKGMVFGRKLMNKAIELNLDGFGENGEFHSLAEVWSVSRNQALGVEKG
ncbi:hypothetical protein ACHAXN_012028 [Cyclotella atomus]